jgi:DNA-binding transcriptional MerR regulator
MAEMHQGPFFNLKAVLQQTGLKPDTLRAWERRYGLPSPDRSEGGHRLYSQRDIDTIKWLMARQREGLSIRRAVDLWRQIEGEGRNALHAVLPIATRAVSAPAPRPVGGTLVELREAWIKAAMDYDERQAEQILTQAFALYSPETVVLELLQPAVAEIGEGWYRGQVTVQQEHFASSLVIRKLEALIMAAPPPSRPGRILAACPPEENHVIALLLLTLLLRRRGWEVVYLGANVPAERLEITIRVTQPQLVLLAAQQLHTAATLLDIAQVVQQEGVALAYGGLIFNLLPNVRKRIPGHFLGEQLDQAPQVVETLMIAPLPGPSTEAIPDAYLLAREHFHQRQGLIEAQLVQDLTAKGIALNHLAMANKELGQNIGAALALGDMRYLGTDIEWVEGLMRNYHIPIESLYAYLRAYHHVAREQLDQRGEPVVAWLSTMLNGNSLD